MKLPIMHTRFSLNFLLLLTLQCAVAIFGVAATQSSLAEELSYAQATVELKGYCISEICLGTTIEEVSTQGKIAFSDFGLPDGKLTCSDTFGNLAFGDLTTKDGRAFNVTFSLVSATGKPEARYRLTDVKLKLPAISELQIDHLRKTLTTRYGLRKVGEPELNLWIATTRSGQFSVSVMKWWARPDVPREDFEKNKGLSMGARYLQKKEWLITQPECRSGLPKI